jgi:hypothetical protein
MDDTQVRYREQLVALEQKAQESYDKAVLTLSGGALGVSFAFVSNFVERGATLAPWALVGAWLSWALSVTATLFSHFTSTWALRRGIEDVDRGQLPVWRSNWYDRMTAVLNAAAGLLFLVGVLFIAGFVWRNVMTEPRTAATQPGNLEKKGYRVPPPPRPSTDQTGTQQQPPKETPKSEK